MKKVIFVILISLLLCSGIVYATNLYKSEDISYTTSDGIKTNVNEALNSLYAASEELKDSLSSSKKVKYGTFTSTNDGKVEIQVEFEPSVIIYYGTNSATYLTSYIYVKDNHNLGIYTGSGGTAKNVISNLTYENNILKFTIGDVYGSNSVMYAGTFSYILIE